VLALNPILKFRAERGIHILAKNRRDRASSPTSRVIGNPSLFGDTNGLPQVGSFDFPMTAMTAIPRDSGDS